jgi:predicted alpha/beta-hydrolase family hydrolase
MLAGGKSMGGRMTSQAASEGPLPGVRGLCFVGFPLHPARAPGTTRADHLAEIGLPMLFLQGTRDALAELELLRPVCAGLGDRATLHVVGGADHGFAVLKRSGLTGDDVLAELVATVVSWAERLTS